VGVVGVVFGHFHYYWIAPKTGDECFAMRGKGVATARCGGGKLAVNDENKLVSAHGFYPFVVVAILHHQINSGEPTVNEKLAIILKAAVAVPTWGTDVEAYAATKEVGAITWYSLRLGASRAGCTNGARRRRRRATVAHYVASK